MLNTLTNSVHWRCKLGGEVFNSSAVSLVILRIIMNLLSTISAQFLLKRLMLVLKALRLLKSGKTCRDGYHTTFGTLTVSVETCALKAFSYFRYRNILIHYQWQSMWVPLHLLSKYFESQIVLPSIILHFQFNKWYPFTLIQFVLFLITVKF